MNGILPDVNFQGHFARLLYVLNSPDWRSEWVRLNLGTPTFRSLGLHPRTSDRLVYERCRELGLCLITGNRNHNGPDSLEAAIRENKDSKWVDDFDAFRRQFEFTGAAAGAMAEYARLRKAHEPEAQKLWAEARRAFGDGNKDDGYRVCEEIVGKYYASSYHRYARSALEERR